MKKTFLVIALLILLSAITFGQGSGTGRTYQPSAPFGAWIMVDSVGWPVSIEGKYQLITTERKQEIESRSLGDSTQWLYVTILERPRR